MFGVTILGNNSAVPTNNRYPTSQVVTFKDQLFLVDCGEGTQMQMSRFKIRRSRIDHIFISHLHGDHYFGLIGLLTSFSLIGRKTPLNLYASPALKDILDIQLSCGATTLGFQVIFIPLLPESSRVLFNSKDLSVSSFQTNHRIPCFGFLFEEKKEKRRILPALADNYRVPKTYFPRLQEGEDFIRDDGSRVPNEMVTSPPSQPRKYAYCADTLYDESLIPSIHQCNLVYHETTYLQDQLERAVQRYHSTTIQAGNLASKAEVKRLIIGHFSSKYEDLTPFEQECRTVFPQTEIAEQGVTFLVQ